MSQCFNIVYLAVGFTAGQLTVLNGQTALGYPFTPNGPRRLLLAQTGSWNMGRAYPLCPGTSDINLFCYCHSIIHFDAEISDRAFDFGVAEQRLHGSQVTIAPAN